MQLEGGFEKIRIAKHGVNQEKVNRFLRWVEAQEYIVWDLSGDNRYEIDGISKKTQKEIQHWLESIGRKFKQPILRSGIMCRADGCYNESEYGQFYCPSCNRKVQQAKVERQRQEAQRNTCSLRGCTNEAKRHTPFCYTHQPDRSW